MATKMTLTRETPKHKEPSNYEVVREYRKERQHVMALEKELHKHEKTDMSHAHPSHSPSATAHGQSQAPLPNMRKG
jgi:hypothetical protein